MFSFLLGERERINLHLNRDILLTGVKIYQVEIERQRNSWIESKRETERQVYKEQEEKRQGDGAGRRGGEKRHGEGAGEKREIEGAGRRWSGDGAGRRWSGERGREKMEGNGDWVGDGGGQH